MKSRYDEMEHDAALFPAQNPRVWELFVQFTFEVIERGFTNYSVNGVFERIRWEADFADADGNSTFKLAFASADILSKLSARFVPMVWI